MSQCPEHLSGWETPPGCLGLFEADLLGGTPLSQDVGGGLKTCVVPPDLPWPPPLVLAPASLYPVASESEQSSNPGSAPGQWVSYFSLSHVFPIWGQ